MYHEYTQEELRAYCRTNIESLEIWARRLIHERMTEKYGVDYFEKRLEGENYLVKKEVREHAQRMLESNPGRFQRAIDTLFIDHIIYFLCNEKWYKELFKEALDHAYPQGCAEAREFLSRLVPVRNPLCHSNPITVHQVEQAICYSHDFIEGLKQYYKKKGLEKMWNVPRIIRVEDSLGNVFEKPDEKICIQIKQPLYCGDVYSVSVEVDASFSSLDYDIVWRDKSERVDTFNNMEKFVIKLTERDIDEIHEIRCEIISHKPWHRHGIYDSKVALHLMVLPPISE